MVVCARVFVRMLVLVRVCMMQVCAYLQSQGEEAAPTLASKGGTHIESSELAAASSQAEILELAQEVEEWQSRWDGRQSGMQLSLESYISRIEAVGGGPVENQLLRELVTPPHPRTSKTHASRVVAVRPE